MNIKRVLKPIRFTENGDIDKNDLLILSILFLWFLIVLYFNPMLLALLIGEEPVMAKISVVIFVLGINMMWLYGLYHIVHIFFSYFVHAPIKSAKKLQGPFPPVAILYMARNDFNEKACLTCVAQEYRDFRVFICDDSDNEDIKRNIDLFCEKNQPIVRVLRRDTNRGYKAGNINDALKKIKKHFEYIAVNDADTELPADFLHNLMPEFTLSPKIAFVQAAQGALKDQKGYFGKAMKPMIDIHWRHYMSLKNKFGFVMWYGHGAVLKRPVIDEMGGIPEVVTEDLAFSSEIRTKGYYGIIDENTVCGEEFPRTIEKFRKRNRKWVRGTYQYLTMFYPQILRAECVPWFEKADIFISAFALLQAIPFLLLVGVASFIMPFYYTVSQARGPLFLVPPLFYDNLAQVILRTRYNVFWVFDFYLIMFLVIFCPLIPAIIDMRDKRAHMLRYMGVSSFLHLSILLDSAKEIILYVLTGKTYFPATNNISEKSDNQYWVLTEMFAGAGLIAFAFYTYNLWLVSLGTAFALTFAVIYWQEKKIVKVLIPVPFAVTAAIMFFIGITIFQNVR
ncbi:MAG: glycosyltransferase [Candidatus Omnitrophica bacterium]|nr:glycosyltransferase [Candidatus Omnitrophota bacterium]